MNTLTDDQRRLVESYMPIARHLARKRARWISRTAGDYRELFDQCMSDAYLALTIAATTHDAAKGVFGTHAYAAIAFRLRNSHRLHAINDRWVDRSTGRLTNSATVSLRVGFTKVIDGDLWEPEDTDDHPCDWVSEEAFEALIADLSARQRTIVRMRYRDEMTFIEIGEQLGISRQMVEYHVRLALRQLRDQMGV